jgi:hypothetical protein
LHEETVHLGGWMPFDRARAMVERFRRVTLSESTLRRMTEGAGAVYERQQAQAVERLERERPAAPEGAATLLVSVDGAMVPLVGGEWAEVKTLLVGEVGKPIVVKGEPEVHTTQHSTYSRLTDAETFTRGAALELHRRGVSAAKTVVAPTDGAEWIEGFRGCTARGRCGSSTSRTPPSD